MEDDPEWLAELRAQIVCREDPWVVLEGRQAVEAAMAGWWDISGIMAGVDCVWDPPDWSGLEVLRRGNEVLEQVVGRPFPEGVLGLARQPDETADVAGLVGELEADSLVVVCPHLSEGLAAGEVIRCAAAIGAQAVLLGREGASPFDREALNASDGGLFRIPVRVADGGQILRCLKAGGFEMVGVSGDEKAPCLREVELGTKRLALVLGSDAEGLGSFWKSACDHLVRISPAGGSGSLGVSASCGVMLWEVMGRRESE